MAAPFPVPLICPFPLPRSFAEKLGIEEALLPLLLPENLEVMRTFIPACEEKTEEAVTALRERIKNFSVSGYLGYAFVVQPGSAKRSLIVYAPPWRLMLSSNGKDADAAHNLGYKIACLFGQKHPVFNYCVEPVYDPRVFPDIPVDPIPHVLLPNLMVIHDVDAGRAGLWRLDQGGILLNGMDPW